MDGGKDCRRPVRLETKATALHYTEGAPEQGLGGRCAQTDDDAGFDERNLLLKPGQAGAHFARVRRLVDAPLGAGVARPFEVLHRIRDVDGIAVDAGSHERAVKQFSRWANKRPALGVFDVARLFTDHDNLSARRPFAEHRLRADLVQVAPATAFRRGPKLGQRGPRWNEISGRPGWLHCSFRLRRAADGPR